MLDIIFCLYSFIAVRVHGWLTWMNLSALQLAALPPKLPKILLTDQPDQDK